MVALREELGTTLGSNDPLPQILQKCTEILVKRLDLAFARVWTLAHGSDTLRLEASAGLYTHLDGPHGSVKVGHLKIGRIAQERVPHLTNAVVGDPLVGDQDWATREGMVAFAGYPLLVNGQVVGVMALFARHALSHQTLDGMAAVANSVSLGIQRDHAEHVSCAGHTDAGRKAVLRIDR